MPKPKADDKEQSKRFIEKAKEVVEESTEEVFEHAIKKIVPPKKGSSK